MGEDISRGTSIIFQKIRDSIEETKKYFGKTFHWSFLIRMVNLLTKRMYEFILFNS